MNTDRKLMQQALEALEQVAEYFNADSTEAKTIIALRKRLVQPDPSAYWHNEFLKHNTTSEQPAQQPEPCQCPECQVTPHASDCAVHNEPAYPKGACNCRAQPEQEPVAWMHPDGRIWTFGRGFDKSTFTIPLYTTPPQRKPLTDEDIVKITSDPCLYIRGGDYRIDIARAIEAAHGIKE